MKTLTPEEQKALVEEKLRALGIDPKDPKWFSAKAVDLGDLPTLSQSREALSSLEKILETQLQSYQDQLIQLREAQAKMRRGGGE